jgi:uncharacterized protein (TIGR00251 family)
LDLKFFESDTKRHVNSSYLYLKSQTLTMLTIRQTSRGLSFDIRVIPGASKNEVAGIQDGALKVRLTAPPVEGKANRACVDFLAGLLGVRRSALAIASGEKSRKKTVSVEGITRGELEARLKDILEP